MATKKEVSVQEDESKVVALNNAFSLEADAGVDHYDSRDVAIPFFTILQPLSPQVNKRDSAYVEGAEPGMFYNSATGEVFDGEKGMFVVLVTHSRRFTEWWPRDSRKGKGLVEDFGTNEDAAKARVLDLKSYPWMTADDTQIIEAGVYYALAMADQDSPPIRGVINLQGTQFKKYKNLNSITSSWMLRGARGNFFNPPIFARAYKMTSIPEQNDQGNWFGFKFAPGPVLVKTGDEKLDASLWQNGDLLYGLAKAFRAQVEGGEVKVAAPPAEAANEEDIPF